MQLSTKTAMCKTATSIGMICLSLCMAGIGFAKTIEGHKSDAGFHHDRQIKAGPHGETLGMRATHRAELHKEGARHNRRHEGTAHSVAPQHTGKSTYRSERHVHGVVPHHHSSAPLQ